MTSENRNFKIAQMIALAIGGVIVSIAVVNYPWIAGAAVVIAVIVLCSTINAGSWP